MKRWTLLLSLLLGLLMACDETTHPSVIQELREWQPGQVVAVVDGYPIGENEFLHYWAAHPEKSRREVLDALVARQAVVSKSLVSTSSAGPEATHARKQALAKESLREMLKSVEETAEIEPDNAAYVEAFARLGAPKGYRVSHVVVMPADLKKVEEMREELLVEAEKILRTLPKDADSFDVVEAASKADLPDGMVATLDLHLVTMDPSQQQYEKPRGWSTLDRDFMEGLLEMVENDWRVSPEPVRSNFGWHAIVLEDVIEGKQPPMEEVEKLARKFAAQNEASKELNDMILTKMKASDWWVSSKSLVSNEAESP